MWKFANETHHELNFFGISVRASLYCVCVLVCVYGWIAFNILIRLLRTAITIKYKVIVSYPREKKNAEIRLAQVMSLEFKWFSFLFFRLVASAIDRFVKKKTKYYFDVSKMSTLSTAQRATSFVSSISTQLCVVSNKRKSQITSRHVISITVMSENSFGASNTFNCRIDGK